MYYSTYLYTYRKCITQFEFLYCKYPFGTERIFNQSKNFKMKNNAELSAAYCYAVEHTALEHKLLFSFLVGTSLTNYELTQQKLLLMKVYLT